MGHVTEDVSCIAHYLVVTMSFDVTDEPYTTHAAAQEMSRGVKGWPVSYETSQQVTSPGGTYKGWVRGVGALGQSGCRDCLVVGERS
jgi:hypothetical protein